MPDWTTISGLATGAGTLVLAIATFTSVRSSNRTARAAERSVLAGIKPFLIPSRPQDPVEKVGFADDHWIVVEGGSGAAEVANGAIYFAIALKNSGNGMALLDRWCVYPEPDRDRAQVHDDVATFRRLTRDLYIAANDFGFWQGAVREADDPQWGLIAEAIAQRRVIPIDLLYSDLEGGQRTITRIALRPKHTGDGWISSVSRHWYLDQPDPR